METVGRLMPFGQYRSFEDCVRANADKRDPKAYCATIERAITEHRNGNKVKHRKLHVKM